MTHDELLAEIDWISSLQTEGGDSLASINASIPAALNALRAVVELHKPDRVPFGYTGPSRLCRHCRKENLLHFATQKSLRVLYPCPTIQAIEKELA